MTDPVARSARTYHPNSSVDDESCGATRPPKAPSRPDSLADAWERWESATDGTKPWCETPQREADSSPLPDVAEPESPAPAMWCEPEAPETSVSWECWNDCVANQGGTMLGSGVVAGIAAALGPAYGVGALAFSAGLYGGACYEACADLESAGVRCEVLGEVSPPPVVCADLPDASVDPADASGYAVPR